MKDDIKHLLLAIGAIAFAIGIIGVSFKYSNDEDRELQKLKHCEELHTLSSKGRDVMVVICDRD